MTELATTSNLAGGSISDLVKGSDKQVVVIVAGGGNSNRALAQWLGVTPEPPSREDLLADADFQDVLAEVSAYVESRQYHGVSASVFRLPSTRNQFNRSARALAAVKYGDKYDEDNPEHFIDIDQWYHDNIIVPNDVQVWVEGRQTADEREFMPVPEWHGPCANWLSLLIELEFSLPGTVHILYNCIKFEDKLIAKFKERRIDATNHGGSVDATPLDPAISNFYAASANLGGGGGGFGFPTATGGPQVPYNTAPPF